MEKIKVEIDWADRNYSCGYGLEGVGVVICTAKSVERLKQEFEETLRWHVETMAQAGDELPEWLLDGDYSIEYELTTAALLRQAERFTTMAAISRVTGINQKLLSHYASALKIPRNRQRQKIIDGLHSIGQEFLAFQ